MVRDPAISSASATWSACFLVRGRATVTASATWSGRHCCRRRSGCLFVGRAAARVRCCFFSCCPSFFFWCCCWTWLAALSCDYTQQRSRRHQQNAALPYFGCVLALEVRFLQNHCSSNRVHCKVALQAQQRWHLGVLQPFLGVRRSSSNPHGNEGSALVLIRSRNAATSLFRPSESFSSHFAAGHLSLQASSSAAETGSWRIAQLQTSLVSFGSLRNTRRPATR